jgi:preprotein translocase subunit SecE
MAETQIPASASSRDTALLVTSIVVLLGGVVAFYVYDEQPLLLRVAMVAGGLAMALGLMWPSWYGREFRQFAVAARIELRKVVWPTQEETGKTTIVVFVFAFLMGVFFWLLDMGLSYLTRLLGGQTG